MTAFRLSIYSAVVLALMAPSPGAHAYSAIPGDTGPVTAGSGSVEQTCEVTEWQVSWGVKESFRAYLSGALAMGEWTTEGDVSYSTPVFSFAGDRGNVSADGSWGEMTSEGSIRFFGHDGLLDQTLAQPTLRIDHSRLFVVFDVSGDTQEGLPIDQDDVEFVLVDTSQAVIDENTGTWSISQAPTVLTEEGAAAFGTYPAGESFDPIDVVISTTPGCLTASNNTPWFLGLGIGLAVTTLAAIVLVRRWRGRGHRE